MIQKIKIKYIFELITIYKKLNSRVRKDIDDISEATNTNRLSCLRQFDNIQRMFDLCDEQGK